MEWWQQGGHTLYRITGPLVPSLLANEFVYHEPPGEAPFHAIVKEIHGRTALLSTLKDYSHQKNNVWGITARNREQNFALNLLMNPEVDFVTLLGQAGTGKTLLTLAAGLMLTLEFKVYTEIIMTRVTVPVGEDIGFLPGTEEEKMNPWMGALEDNLDVLNKTDDEAGEWGRAATRDLIRSRIKVKSLNFMRGRTFINKFLIIDEAQNLTPKQMKTLITRAGPGTKVVCLGNIAQIDTPYLTEGSSGLTYVVDRFKGWSHSGHVTLHARRALAARRPRGRDPLTGHCLRGSALSPTPAARCNEPRRPEARPTGTPMWVRLQLPLGRGGSTLPARRATRSPIAPRQSRP